MSTLLIIAAIIFVIYLISKAMSPSSKKSRTSTPWTYTSDREHVSTKTKRKPVRVQKKQVTDIDLANIEINEDFKCALDMIEGRNENVYVTGNAGTGKSTLLKYLRATTKKNVVVLAPTGIAAINVSGQTIHSFFRLPPKLIKVEDIRSSRNAILFRSLMR